MLDIPAKRVSKSPIVSSCRLCIYPFETKKFYLSQEVTVNLPSDFMLVPEGELMPCLSRRAFVEILYRSFSWEEDETLFKEKSERI